MEFTHGRRDRLSFTDLEEEHVEISKQYPSSSLPSSSTAFSSGGSGGGVSLTERKHMFDKVVTPSDVGKLNRLVIPKQHAEKYFPLDTSANEKGLQLSFEDRTGKPWRFRYSYWNSSQSYVMTKGWSRFVKEKGLDAGDTVSFGRGVGEAGRHRLYIDWERRTQSRGPPPRIPFPGASSAPWSAARLFVPQAVGVRGHTYGAASWSGGGGQLLCYRLPAATPPQMEVQQVGGSGVPVVLKSLPLARNQAAVKRVRLFGVNLDCPGSRADANYESDSLSVCVPQLHPRTALPLFQPPVAGGGETLGGAVSSSSVIYCKEQHSPSPVLDP